MNRRVALKQLSALAALSLVGGVSHAQQEQFKTLSAKIPTEAPGKVEVIEFFSYGCPHCNDFEPLLSRWSKALPADVNFMKVPVTFNRQQWTVLARLYYTLEAMGEANKLSPAVFAAIHEQHRKLDQEDGLFEWVGSVTDAKRFTETYKSFGVQSRLQRATQLAAAYRVDGVPMMAVDGRFVTSASQTGGYDQMLKVVDQLIARSRTEKGRS
ncbi:MAG TPA: thiol:disulfide interchange protein DsbA/DsbL [Aromatoleum sp.]|uniref:thiol:disulfide interchange protein DsbA/DsbL n=1 Tax=Aromatoleum sp. TaxID=2307007 RepID=UPI002B49EBEE|nr:thiol:disulfide interchange protein DsbA/DsbL [Aromatoleum sp.]HJV26531.1 thiol:disulfide interchange protein DsbA/DsbL [Aromatoleum sp.]